MSLKKYDLWKNTFFYKVIEAHRLVHAYIVLGPDHQKKIWVANSMAKALICTAHGATYCDVCPSCVRINSHNHPDVLWLYPSGIQRIIKIDQVRDLQAALALKSFEGGKKIAFILHADRMKEEAANALLKTIEEPPENTYIILISDTIESLLPTIRSRCQHVTLPLSSNDDIRTYLVDDCNVSEQQAQFICARARGNFSIVHRYLNEQRSNWRNFIVSSLVDLLNERRDPFELAEEIESGIQNIAGLSSEDQKRPEDDAMAESDKKSIEKSLYNQEVCDYFETIELFCRDVIIYKLTNDKHQLVNSDKLQDISHLANVFELDALSDFLDRLQQAYHAFLGNTKLEFALEILYDSLLLTGMPRRN